jgi:hypothetical protein
MIGIEAVIVANARRRARTEGGVWISRCGSWGAVPHAQASVEAIPLTEIHISGAQVVADQPRALREKKQQHGSGDPLWLANRSQHKKSGEE